MRYLYLHGFASGPASRKALAFAAAMRQCVATVEIPALDQGDFEHLTITSQLGVIDGLLQNEPARLIGSSMGGYVAALYAAAHPEIDRLVLLAPAFQFGSRWLEITGREKIRKWEETGWLEVFHYGSGCMRRIHRDLLDDALKYPAAPGFIQPAHIFHGRHDQIVPIDTSREFAATHPNAGLTELESGHELLNVLSEITDAAIPFLMA
jgi:pimeloyl-ACP methyl ester carboxylesterase